MSRMHGERPAEYAARQAFEAERRRTPPMELQSNAVLIYLPCDCSKWPFAHYHDGAAWFVQEDRRG